MRVQRVGAITQGREPQERQGSRKTFGQEVKKDPLAVNPLSQLWIQMFSSRVFPFHCTPSL